MGPSTNSDNSSSTVRKKGNSTATKASAIIQSAAAVVTSSRRKAKSPTVNDATTTFMTPTPSSRMVMVGVDTSERNDYDSNDNHVAVNESKTESKVTELSQAFAEIA